jgi:phosphohistidine phosphatase SixA
MHAPAELRRNRPSLDVETTPTAVVAGRLLACLFLVVAPSATATEDLWKVLESGGRVVLMRHTITTPGAGDPPGMRLDDCSTQRNLTDEGRRHARAIGEAFRGRRIGVDRVLSSPWCRCLETAQLAFGRAEATPSLSNLFGRSENARQQVEAMRALVDGHRDKGNLVLVSHGSTIVALTGISPDTGEMVVVTRRPEGAFSIEGRLTVATR